MADWLDIVRAEQARERELYLEYLEDGHDGDTAAELARESILAAALAEFIVQRPTSNGGSQ